jgi:uncharacterized membrane-anchored protein
MKSKLLKVGLIFPIIALLLLTFQKAYVKSQGEKFELAISGYDPVDILSGHYVTYQIDYGINVCESGKSCLCLEKIDGLTVVTPVSCESKKCDYYLKGTCVGSRFNAGIEKFFISEERANEMDRIVRQGKSKVRISVDTKGNAVVEDLLLVE